MKKVSVKRFTYTSLAALALAGTFATSSLQNVSATTATSSSAKIGDEEYAAPTIELRQFGNGSYDLLIVSGSDDYAYSLSTSAFDFTDGAGYSATLELPKDALSELQKSGELYGVPGGVDSVGGVTSTKSLPLSDIDKLGTLFADSDIETSVVKLSNGMTIINMVKNMGDGTFNVQNYRLSAAGKILQSGTENGESADAIADGRENGSLYDGLLSQGLLGTITSINGVPFTGTIESIFDNGGALVDPETFDVPDLDASFTTDNTSTERVVFGNGDFAIAKIRDNGDGTYTVESFLYSPDGSNMAMQGPTTMTAAELYAKRLTGELFTSDFEYMVDGGVTSINGTPVDNPDTTQNVMSENVVYADGTSVKMTAKSDGEGNFIIARDAYAADGSLAEHYDDDTLTDSGQIAYIIDDYLPEPVTTEGNVASVNGISLVKATDVTDHSDDNSADGDNSYVSGNADDNGDTETTGTTDNGSDTETTGTTDNGGSTETAGTTDNGGSTDTTGTTDNGGDTETTGTTDNGGSTETAGTTDNGGSDTETTGTTDNDGDTDTTGTTDNGGSTETAGTTDNGGDTETTGTTGTNDNGGSTDTTGTTDNGGSTDTTGTTDNGGSTETAGTTDNGGSDTETTGTTDNDGDTDTTGTTDNGGDTETTDTTDNGNGTETTGTTDNGNGTETTGTNDNGNGTETTGTTDNGGSTETTGTTDNGGSTETTDTTDNGSSTTKTGATDNGDSTDTTSATDNNAETTGTTTAINDGTDTETTGSLGNGGSDEAVTADNSGSSDIDATSPTDDGGNTSKRDLKSTTESKKADKAYPQTGNEKSTTLSIAGVLGLTAVALMKLFGFNKREM